MNESTLPGIPGRVLFACLLFVLDRVQLLLPREL